MDGYPIDYVADKPSKREEKIMLKQMGDFADFCMELEKTHYWCEKTKQHILKNDNMDLPRSAFRNDLISKYVLGETK